MLITPTKRADKMSETPPHIMVDVCIATYRRPRRLTALLQALQSQHLPPNVSIRVIVVDNDQQGSAREIVKKQKHIEGSAIVYEIEPKKNISLARNRSLRLAQGQFVLFIDDDEVPAKNWLKNHLTAAKKYEADVVFGPVSPNYTSEVPSWIFRSGCLDRKSHHTGETIKHGATNNTLVRRTVFSNMDQWFKPEYGLTGGGDFELFFRLHCLGKKMIWCEDARVTETVDSNRLTLAWLLRRGYRGGQCFYRVIYAPAGMVRKLLWFLITLGKGFGYSGLVLLSLLGGRHKAVRPALKLAGVIGQLTAPFGRYYSEYKATE